MNLPINECPQCDGVVFYRKDYMEGSSHYLASNMIEVDNGSMHDSLRTTYGKWWYCEHCHKPVFKDEDVE